MRPFALLAILAVAVLADNHAAPADMDPDAHMNDEHKDGHEDEKNTAEILMEIGDAIAEMIIEVKEDETDPSGARARIIIDQARDITKAFCMMDDEHKDDEHKEDEDRGPTRRLDGHETA